MKNTKQLFMTLLITAVMTFGGSATQKAWGEETDLRTKSALQAKQILFFQCKESSIRGTLYYDADYSSHGVKELTTTWWMTNKGSKISTQLDKTDAKQQFSLIQYSGNYYLYNISAKKFVKWDKDNGLSLTKDYSSAMVVSFTDANSGDNDYNWNIWYANASGTFTRINLNQGGPIVMKDVSNASNDGGNQFKIYSVGTMTDEQYSEACNLLPSSYSKLTWDKDTCFSWFPNDDTPSGIQNLSGYTVDKTKVRCQRYYLQCGQSGNGSVTLVYKSGTHALHILGVDVVNAKGSVVSYDYHYGKTGDTSSNNVYSISFKETGIYELRVFADNKQGDEITSTGTVSIIGASQAGCTPESGKFYIIRGDGPYPYLTSEQSNNDIKVSTSVTQTGLYYWDGSQLLNYQTGYYMSYNSNGIGLNLQKKQTTSITKADKKCYICVANAYLHNNRNSNTDEGTHTGGKSATLFNHWTFTEVTSLPLTIGSTGYATYSVPVDVEIPEGVEVYYAKSYSRPTLTLKKIDNKIPANTGVVLHTNTPGTYYFNVTSGATPISGNKLKPIVAAQTIPLVTGDYTALILASEGGNAVFCPLSSDGNVVAGHRAYLEIATANLPDPTTSVKGISLSFEDDTETGINEVNATSTGSATDTIYNLAGQRVNGLQKGINIVNGKKVLY